MTTRSVVVVFALVSGIVAQSRDGYAIRVHVTNSVTAAPVAGADVVLRNVSEEKVWGRTDSNGVFIGKSQASGKYVLTVSHKGYEMKHVALMGKMVEIRPDAQNDIAVEMLPLGIIAGRIVDQYGDPVRNAKVRALVKEDLPGLGGGYGPRGGANTDDRGEYRLANIEPGTYYVGAEYRSDEFGQPNRRGPSVGGFALLPDVTDTVNAQPVEVTAGNTIRISDIRIHLQRAVTISGSIKPAVDAYLTIHRSGTLPFDTFAVFGTGAENGVFTQYVLPGSYVLSASDEKTGRVSKEIIVDAQKNVSGIELSLDARYEIRGHISIEGTETLDFSKVQLSFMSGPLKLGSDGTFQVQGFPGKQRYHLRLPEGWFAKDVLVDGKHIASHWFEVKAPTTEISFVLSPHGATIEATRPAGTSLLEALVVILLPENASSFDSIVQLVPDDAGKLVAHGVPPGSYRVFALDAANSMLIMRPDLLMEKYGKSAPSVQIAEGEHKSFVVQPTKVQPE